MSLVTNLFGNLKFKYAKDAGGINALYEPDIELNDALATGVALDTADLVYVSQDKSLGGSATDSLDLAGGLTDAFGTTLTFVKLKAVYIHNKSTTAGNTIKVGGDVNGVLIFDAAADTRNIGPNGRMLIWEPSLAGIAVTAGTGDILKILNNTANAITYDIAIVGTSS